MTTGQVDPKDNYWEYVIQQMTGYDLPSRQSIQDSKGAGGIPWINVTINQIAWDMEAKYWAHEDGLGWDIQFYSGEKSDVLKYQATVRYTDHATNGILFWQRSAEALLSLIGKPHKTVGANTQHGGLPAEGRGVDLTSFTTVAKAFDAAGDFFSTHAEELSQWVDQLGAENASWKGQAAGVFWHLLDDLRGKYDAYKQELFPSHTAPYNVSSSTGYHPRTLHANSLIGAENALHSTLVDLYDYIRAFTNGSGSAPISLQLPDGKVSSGIVKGDTRWILNDVFAEVAKWMVSHNAHNVTETSFDDATIVSTQYYDYAEHRPGKLAGTTPKYEDTVSWGNLKDTSAWSGMAQESMNRWMKTVKANLDIPAADRLGILAADWGHILNAGWSGSFAFVDSHVTSLQQELDLEEREIAKAQADADRAKADADRAKADADRAKADADRAKADADRAKAEAANNKFTDDLNNEFNGIGDGIRAIGDGVNDGLNGINDNVITGIGDLGSGVRAIGDGVNTGLNGINDNVITGIGDLGSGVRAIGDGVNTGLNGLGSGLTGLNTGLTGLADGLGGGGGGGGLGGGGGPISYASLTPTTFLPHPLLDIEPGPTSSGNADGSTVTQNADGSVTTLFPDGSSSTVSPNGVVTTRQSNGSTATTRLGSGEELTNPDGSTTAIGSDGSVSTRFPDGSTITQNADGSLTTQDPDGTSTTHFANGTVETTGADGLTHLTAPDGTTMTQNADGSLTSDFVDGSSSTVNPDGTITTTTTDGHTVVGHLTDGQSLVNPDGSATTIGSDGGITTHFGDGSSVTVNPDGTVTTTDATGTGKSPLGSDVGLGSDTTTTRGSTILTSSSGLTVGQGDGSTVTHFPTGATATTDLNGTTTTRFPDGSSMVSNADGQFRTLPSPQTAAAEFAAQETGGGLDASITGSGGAAASSDAGLSSLMSPMMMMMGMSRMGGQGGGRGEGERVREVYQQGDSDGAYIHGGGYGQQAPVSEEGEFEEEETDLDELPRSTSPTGQGHRGGTAFRPSTQSSHPSHRTDDVWGTGEEGLPASLGR